MANATIGSITANDSAPVSSKRLKEILKKRWGEMTDEDKALLPPDVRQNREARAAGQAKRRAKAAKAKKVATPKHSTEQREKWAAAKRKGRKASPKAEARQQREEHALSGWRKPTDDVSELIAGLRSNLPSQEMIKLVLVLHRPDGPEQLRKAIGTMSVSDAFFKAMQG